MFKSLLPAALLSVLGIGAPAAKAPRVVTVEAYDFRFVAPATIPAGTVSFQLKNLGKEIHHLWIVQLTDGKTPAEFMEVTKRWGSALKMPSWAVDVGGPNTAAPGKTAEGTVTLTPGTYMLVCWIPSNDGIIHVMKGMVRSLTVTKRGETAPVAPHADVDMVLDDYSFTLSKPLTPGRHVIRVENRAEQSHEVVVAKLHPGRSINDAVVWLNAGQDGSPTATPIGGASGLAKGRHMYMTLDLEPGRYLLLCFIPDVKSGKPHSDHGMFKEIVVE